MTTKPKAKKRPAIATAKKPDLTEVFDQVQSLLQRHAPPFHGHSGSVKNKRDYHLISHKKVTIAGRARNELYFASVIQQGAFVGFYFNVAPELRKRISPDLLKLLKGKSCFHVKKMDDKLCEDIASALEIGRESYEKKDWV